MRSGDFEPRGAEANPPGGRWEAGRGRRVWVGGWLENCKYVALSESKEVPQIAAYRATQ